MVTAWPVPRKQKIFDSLGGSKKESRMTRRVLRWSVAGLILVVTLVSTVYLRDINHTYDRISGKSTVIASPYGDIEYTEGGSGPLALVIHGSGGGYDQGELIAQTVLGDQFRWIAPSRFGYLRSTFHEGANWDDQGHTYAYLLDRLGVKKVALVAMSHGCPSALVFAILYPERISSLTLISCGIAPSSTQDQAQADKKGKMLTAIFNYDFPYWFISKAFKNQLMELIGANDSVIAGLTENQREVVARYIAYMNPVSLRSAGADFDIKARLPGKRIAAIKKPTLILHATDDTLQLFHNAEFAASTIRNARLIRFESGGHLLMIVEQSTVRATVKKHILNNADKGA